MISALDGLAGPGMIGFRRNVGGAGAAKELDVAGNFDRQTRSDVLWTFRSVFSIFSAFFALGCSTTTNAGAATASGAAVAGQTCAPTTQGDVCGTNAGQSAHLKCDPGTKAWTVVEICATAATCSSVNGAFVCVGPTAGQQDTISGDGVGDTVVQDAAIPDVAAADGTVTDVVADGAAQDLVMNDVPAEVQLSDTGTNSDACACIQVGDYYRFSTLELSSLDGNPNFAVIPVLNSLWQSDADTYELNVMLQVSAVSATDVTWKVVDGARVSTTKEPCLLPPTQTTIHQKRSGCTLLDSDASSMNLYSGSQQHPKICGYLTSSALGVDDAIPLHGVVLTGTMHADCSSIDGGIVKTAAIAKDALFKLCTCQSLPGQTSDVCSTPDPNYKDTTSSPPGACDGCGDGWQSFGGLLSAFAGDAGLQYGCKSETGGPAVCLSATFAATRLSAWTPAACGN